LARPVGVHLLLKLTVY